jgi:hypothetical protein
VEHFTGRTGRYAIRTGEKNQFRKYERDPINDVVVWQIHFTWNFAYFSAGSVYCLSSLSFSHLYTPPSSLSNLYRPVPLSSIIPCVFSAATRNAVLFYLTASRRRVPTAMERGCTFQSVTLLHYLAPSTRGLVLSLAGCCRFTLFASCTLFFFPFVSP